MSIIKSKQDFVSGGDSTRKEIDKEVLESGNYFEILFEQMFNELYFEGNAETKFLNSIKHLPEYWRKRAEVLARSFEVYIFHKLNKAGIYNTFLVAKAYGSKSYPDETLINKVTPVIDKIFKKAFEVFTGETKKDTVKNDGAQIKLFSNRSKLDEEEEIDGVSDFIKTAIRKTSETAKHLTAKAKAKIAEEKFQFVIAYLNRYKHELKRLKKQDKEAISAVLNILSKKGTLSGLGFEYQEQKKPLEFSGYLPQYALLESYDHLIDKSTGKIETVGHGGLELTVKTIKKVLSDHRHEVQKLADHLKTGKWDQDNFNVWHFIKINVVYGYDTPGIEEIRTPARTWADRFFKVDCEDYGIFANALLLNMGYKPKLQIVALNGNDFFQHIYAVLNGQANDPVLNEFNKHPDRITNTMEVQVLSGVPACICGIGAIEAPDAVTVQLMNDQTRIISKLKKSYNPALVKELRKVRFMIRLNGTMDRDALLPIMPYLDDITPEGNYIFKDANHLEAIEEYFSTINREIELNGLGDVGNIFKKAAAKIKTTVKKAVTVAKNFAPIKKISQSKVFKAVKKYSPAMIVIRNAYLLLLKVNFLKMSQKFAYGLMSSGEAKAAGLSMVEHPKFIMAVTESIKKFEQFGGSREAFVNAVKKGRGAKKAGLNGLGEVVTLAAVTAAIAAAAPIFLVIMKFLKEAKLKKLTNGAEEDPETEDPEAYTGGEIEPLSALEEGYSSEEERTDALRSMSYGGGDYPQPGSFVSALGFCFKVPLLLSILDFTDWFLIALSAIVTSYCIIGFLVILPLSWMGLKGVDKYFLPLNIFKNLSFGRN